MPPYGVMLSASGKIGAVRLNRSEIIFAVWMMLSVKVEGFLEVLDFVLADVDNITELFCADD